MFGYFLPFDATDSHQYFFLIKRINGADCIIDATVKGHWHLHRSSQHMHEPTSTRRCLGPLHFAWLRPKSRCVARHCERRTTYGCACVSLCVCTCVYVCVCFSSAFRNVLVVLKATRPIKQGEEFTFDYNFDQRYSINFPYVSLALCLPNLYACIERTL